MKKKIPRNPEKHFKKTPKIFSRESKIESLSTYENRNGIVIDNLDGVKGTIETYVTQIRSNYEDKQDSQKVIIATFRDLKKRLNHANEEAMRSKRETLNSLIKETNLLPNLTSDLRKRASTNLGEIIDLFEKCECLHEGGLASPNFSYHVKGSLMEGGFAEIEIEATKHKYVVKIQRMDPDKGSNNEGWFEQELARILGKERLIYETGVRATFNEIDGAWYNIPLFDILNASGLKYIKRTGTILDITSSSLSKVSKKTSKKIGKELIENPSLCKSFILCLPHKRKRYETSFEIENLHSSISPEEIEFNEEMDDEKMTHRYSKVRNGNLVGPAWTFYGGREWARVEKPVLDITLSYAGRDYHDVSVINEDEIGRLVEARDKLVDGLRTLS